MAKTGSAEKAEANLKYIFHTIFNNLTQSAFYWYVRNEDRPVGLEGPDPISFMYIQIVTAINNDKEAILDSAVKSIKKYLTYYSVTSNSPDQLKVAFWLGEVISAKFENENKIHYASVTRVAVLLSLITFLRKIKEEKDSFVGESHCLHMPPYETIQKIIQSYFDNTNSKHYGSHGVYSLLKSYQKAIPYEVFFEKAVG